MEASSTQPVELPKEKDDLERSTRAEKHEETYLNNEVVEDVTENIGVDRYLAKDEEKSDSDSHSDDPSSNDEQNHVGSGTNSQFYESSDSKLDYAVKIDDNDTLSDIDDIKTDSASADSEDSALGSLPPDSAVPDREEEGQDRSEGSDSGIGSETLADVKLSSFNLALPCASSFKSSYDTGSKNDSTRNNTDKDDECHNSLEQKSPVKSNLKRKLNEEHVDQPLLKKKKHSIRFDSVTVYYFPRAQGFSCVPSQGGSTLGMEFEHSHVQKFSLAEHALEQRRLHRQILQQLKSERHSLQGVSLSSSEDSDTEEEASDISESELDLDSYYFLQPVPTRQRRALLRTAGVRKIEGYEKDECRDIRTSREFCGCACKGTCNPETCSCSLGGIKCQVDRLNFPCGCTRDGCSNTTGRIEFNPVRVRTHFIHTLMRVGLEKKNEENQEAAKRQWAQVHIPNTQSQCIPSSGYERDHIINQNDVLVRDIGLSPRVEVGSCVNAGNFNTIHCDMNNVPNQTSQSPYGYRNESIEHRNINENSMRFETTSNHHNLADPYTTNILQGKGPPYSAITAGTMGFEAMPNNMPRFPCDLNYTYDLHNDNNHFKGLHSFSASSFEEFAHSSNMSMLNHYGHNMYTPDYLHKPTTSMHDYSSLQYHNMHQTYYEMYKNPAEFVNNEVKGEYATLMTSPYQASDKLQTAENDENWFSRNALLNLDQSEQATQDVADRQPQLTEAPAKSNNTEPTENFGELIKKTMVDSVTV
ncbi:Cysteine/serine-rich nuclear protein 2 [Operophtera brumata]|uniref:Cysteine/serine-rich nuclear protein 2 n=1 Tax=Operophtera brumata TaxID=104452 RepID=A0A0L7KTW7_OPEBR|nr:Cysteine/serine-rich nuclear protein 2 [Operophtera brumata]